MIIICVKFADNVFNTSSEQLTSDSDFYVIKEKNYDNVRPLPINENFFAQKEVCQLI